MMRYHSPSWYDTGSAYLSSTLRPLLQYARNSRGVVWAVGVLLYPFGMITTCEFAGSLRTSSSGTLVVSSSRYGSLLLLAILNKKVKSNVTAGRGH